jgi:predicted dehydrogenase
MSRRLRVGAFGVGRMGQVHVETLARLSLDGAIDFAAVGDRHEPTRAAVTSLVKSLGIESSPAVFASADEMAGRGRLDAVVLASRTQDHARDILTFTRQDISVMAEKPVAATIAEAAELEREIGGSARRLVQIGFQRHYDAAQRAASRWVADGLIGSVQQSHHVLQDKNPPPPGYQSAGITSDMAIHLIFEAMSFHAFDLPRSVQALRFLAPDYDDDAGEGANIVHAFLTWPDGSVAHLWGSRINSTGYDNSFTLVGTEGRIDVGQFAGDFGTVTGKLWRGTGRDGSSRGTIAESREWPMTRPEPRHPDFYPRYAAAYAEEVREFVERVARGADLEPGLDIGWKTLFVANLAEASSRQSGRRFLLMAGDARGISTAGDAAQFTPD